MEMLDYQIQAIEKVLGFKFEGETEEDKQAFIDEHNIDRVNATNKILEQMYDIYMSNVYAFSSESLQFEDLVVAKTQKEAMETYLEEMGVFDVVLPEDLEVRVLEKYTEQLIIDEELVPEYDKHLWKKEGKCYWVDVIYAVDYYLTCTNQTIPALLI